MVVILKNWAWPQAFFFKVVYRVLKLRQVPKRHVSVKPQIPDSKIPKTQALTTRKPQTYNQDGASLMRRDDSVMCVSGYNDNGFEALSTDSGR